MRDPQLASLKDLESYQPREPGQPRTAVYSLGQLVDMHEAMDAENETIARERAAMERKP